MVTKRSGQAQTALISRRPATVERTRQRHPPKKDQGDNKSSTNRGPGQTDSDSQTRRVKSFGRLGPSGSLGRLGTLPFRSAAPHKAVANQSFAESQAQRGSFVSDIIRRQGWLPMRCLLRGAAPIRDAGEGSGHKRSRNQRRGAADDSQSEKQSEFALLECCRWAMVAKAFPPS